MLDVLKSILQFLGAIVEFVVEFAEWILVKWALMVLDALLAILSLIPVPEWLSNLSGNVALIDSGILFFVAPFQFGTGVAWIISAYLIRFLIRRIPLIG